MLKRSSTSAKVISAMTGHILLLIRFQKRNMFLNIIERTAEQAETIVDN